MPDTTTQSLSRNPNIVDVLDISTAHLTEKDAKLIADDKLPGAMSAWRNEAGFLVNTAWLQTFPDELPASLKACLERAVDYGCSYVLFDLDGPIDDTLPLYEW